MEKQKLSLSVSQWPSQLVLQVTVPLEGGGSKTTHVGRLGTLDDAEQALAKVLEDVRKLKGTQEYE